MKKVFSIICIFILIMGTKVFAQNWSYEGAFPDTSFKGGIGLHGVAVDPDGKVWAQLYGTTDSVDEGGGTYGHVRQIFAFNADGTPASFSGMKIITADGITDTLYNSNRGLRADIDGNILASSYDVLYRLNYKTGEGMNRFVYPNGTGASTLTAVAVDAAGNIFLGPVIPGNPIQIINPDFTLQGNAVDTSVGYSRTLEVSPDGNTIYWAGYTNNAVFVYNRPDEFSPYTVVDTVMKGFECESMGWNPKTGYLWASSGSGLTPPNAYPGATTNYTYPTWYAWDVNTWTVKDSINWHITTPGEDARPRGIAFSPSGDTAYVGCFGANDYPALQMFVNTGATGVEKDNNLVVNNYKLYQNYPNPFNPTTNIKFAVAKEGHVTLKVYDLLGRDVATLVDQEMSAGNYASDFDASRLSSGTYIYTLSVNGVSISKKMMLLK